MLAWVSYALYAWFGLSGQTPLWSVAAALPFFAGFSIWTLSTCYRLCRAQTKLEADAPTREELDRHFAAAAKMADDGRERQDG